MIARTSVPVDMIKDAIQTASATPGEPANGPAKQAESVTLRRATLSDADALALVGAATFLEAFTWMLPGADIVAHCARHHTAEAYAKYLQQPSTRVTLALTGPPDGFRGEPEAPVGYAMVCEPELPSFRVLPTDTELKRIYLFSRFRGAPMAITAHSSSSAPNHDAEGAPDSAGGLPTQRLRPAQALLHAAESDALSLGRTRLLLGTHAGNLPALAFYRRNGFTEVGTRTFQVGSQTCSDLILAKPLTVSGL